MLVIVDGHNLVPKIPGLSLSDFDDEMKLVKLLQEYARLRRRQVEVYFDNPPPGQPRVRKVGTIHVRFARPGYNADEEIRSRLAQLGSAARNSIVVSSDQRVQVYARGARAQVASSENFSQELQATLETPQSGKDSQKEETLNVAEINYWLRIFGENQDNKPDKSG